MFSSDDLSGRAKRTNLGDWRALRTIGLLLLVLLTLTHGDVSARSRKVITLGESLSPDQRNELLDLFGFEAGKDDEPLVVTTADTIKAMNGIFPLESITSAYSSTALTCQTLGEGLDVTTSNITLVTPGLYAMALVTAGIGDATLVVAAPSGLAGVQGMTALTGVFKAWNIAPCDSGSTTKARQRLALDELALTVQIGQALAGPNGVQKATDIVLETQKTIVTKQLKGKTRIDQVIADQERAAGVTIPPDLRTRLVDLMTRLAGEDIDWSTFSAGWNIERPEATRITMTGEGIAIRNAQASATAEANAEMTATAEQRALDANATATASAEAQATLEAQMTATARDGLTATARAQPTATPTPLPTATPSPTTSPPAPPAAIELAGTVADVGGGQIVITGDSEATSSYAVDAGATISRAGQAATLDAISKGDRVIVTLNPTSQLVTKIDATPLPTKTGEQPLQPMALGAAGLLGIALIKRRRGEEPFVIERKSA